MRPHRLLIVDDDRLISWCLARALSALEDLSIWAVETGREAIEEISRTLYDLVLLDVYLPDMDGFRVLDAIRKARPDIKVVMMSGDGSETNRTLAESLGAIRFLEKPFDVFEILSLAKRSLAGSPERRGKARYPCCVPLRIVPIENRGDPAHPGNLPFRGMTADVGSEGLRLVSPLPLRIGQRIRLLASEGYDPFLQFVPRETHAEVRWVQPEGGGSVTAGVRYLS